MNRTKYIAPTLVIVLGFTWLLNILHILPGIDWIWTAGLATVGVLTLAIGKINKLTIVSGPFLIVCATCSMLRQTGHLALNIETPLLVLALGCLMLVSTVSDIPKSDLFKSSEEKTESQNHSD
jgi:hypothetical protein